MIHAMGLWQETKTKEGANPGWVLKKRLCTVGDLANLRLSTDNLLNIVVGSCAWGVKVQETEEMKWKRKYGKDRRELVMGSPLSKP